MSAEASTPLRRLWLAAVALAAAGLALAWELTQIHSRVHADPNTKSFCTLSDHISCDKTAQSIYSVFWGVPLSVWGLLAYGVVLLLCGWGLYSRKTLPIAPFALVSGACAASSLLLIYVSAFLDQNLCILCMASWLVDWALFAIGLAMARRVRASELLARVRGAWSAHPIGVMSFAATGLVLVLAVRFLALQAVAPSAPALTQKVERDEDIKLPHGVDDAGHPFIGGASPKLSVVEFADYQCPHCAHAHNEMRELLAKHPQQIRIVHRQFPLDNKCNSLVTRPFHPHACEYAIMAACATLAGKFWQANDFLFEHGRDEQPVAPETLAARLNLDLQQFKSCMAGPGSELVKADVEEGLRLQMQGTPTFIVDGKSYPGRLPDEMLEPYLK